MYKHFYTLLSRQHFFKGLFHHFYFDFVFLLFSICCSFQKFAIALFSRAHFKGSVYWSFPYAGNWELVKSTMTANGCALLRYTMIISVQKLTQVKKSNTAGFQSITRHNRKILKRPLKQTGIDQKRFPE